MSGKRRMDVRTGERVSKAFVLQAWRSEFNTQVWKCMLGIPGLREVEERRLLGLSGCPAKASQFLSLRPMRDSTSKTKGGYHPRSRNRVNLLGLPCLCTQVCVHTHSEQMWNTFLVSDLGMWSFDMKLMKQLGVEIWGKIIFQKAPKWKYFWKCKNLKFKIEFKLGSFLLKNF